MNRKIIEDTFPQINWDSLRDVNRALNWELWSGPFGHDYWTDCDPLENYTWISVPIAIDDIKSILDELPSIVWFDVDSGSISFSNPEFDDNNWIDDEDRLPIWIGGEWVEIDPRYEVLHDNVYKLIYGQEDV